MPVTINVNEDPPVYTQMTAPPGGGIPDDLFTCTATFTVAGHPAPPVGGPVSATGVAIAGYIVQHVRRTEKTINDSGRAVLMATNQYWEAWEVDALGNVIVPVAAGMLGFHDRFRVAYKAYRLNRNTGAAAPTPEDINTKALTKGKWKIMGKLYWVNADRFAPAQWQDNVPEAGHCLRRWHKPTVGSGLVGSALGSCLRERKFAGEWDNTRTGDDPRKTISQARIPGYWGWGFKHMAHALGTVGV